MSSPREPSSPPSEIDYRATSPAGSQDGLAKARPVTPTLLYSRAVTASPTPEMEFGAQTPSVTPGASREPYKLSSDVDFEDPPADEREDGTPWTKVSRTTSRIHRERSSSPTSNVSHHFSNVVSNTSSTVSRAAQDMSTDELIKLHRRYEALASEVLVTVKQRAISSTPVNATRTPKMVAPLLSSDSHLSKKMNNSHQNDVKGRTPRVSFPPVSPIVPSSAGPSRNKGKGVDPGNWGALYLSDEGEVDLEAQ
ncbi:hypothetical protein C8J57DRAFT_1527285 [Mycena rebaudengoi]|nr:hypothetical protein C8J57DRAFT_1527285 [Mycena rebaudengoi]